MSQEIAKQFLADVAHNTALREKFYTVGNPDEFLNTAQELGYIFTGEEFKAVVQEHSEGVLVRRKTGVWQWLRSVNWM